MFFKLLDGEVINVDSICRIYKYSKTWFLKLKESDDDSLEDKELDEKDKEAIEAMLERSNKLMRAELFVIKDDKKCSER